MLFHGCHSYYLPGGSRAEAARAAFNQYQIVPPPRPPCLCRPPGDALCSAAAGCRSSTYGRSSSAATTTRPATPDGGASADASPAARRAAPTLRTGCSSGRSQIAESAQGERDNNLSSDSFSYRGGGGVTDSEKLRNVSVSHRTRVVHPGPVVKATPTGPAAEVAAVERD